MSCQMTPGSWLLAEAVAKAAGMWTYIAIFGGIAGFMLALRFLGLYLASTHPAPPAAPAPAPKLQVAHPEAHPAVPAGVDPKIIAIIAATVSEVLQRPHRIVSMKKTPSVESLMQQWSMEGRRAIYSSHKFR